MRKTSTIFLILFLFISNLSAQDFNNYKPLRSKGSIPINLKTSSSQKYEIDKENTTSKQAAERQFYLENNFGIDELLRSGQLTFNDPISSYVENILDIILKDQPDLRKELSIYTVQSPSVNAFATDRGEIFVNVGLITKLETEAQLAFILCHELQHYVERHNINSFIEFDKIERGEGVYRSQKSFEKVLAQHSYSKDLEREADKLGFELFLKTGYSLEDGLSVFDLLSLSHVPYANEYFPLDWLEIGNIKITNSYYLGKVDAIKVEKDDDELSTHPSVLERKGAYREWIEEHKDVKGNSFINSRKEFNNIREIARFDICNVLIRRRSYSAAIYHAFVLSEKYPNSKFVKTCIVKSLYGLAQYKNDDRLNEIYHEHADVQGEMQRVFYLLEKLSKPNFNALAIRHCWELFKEYPDDPYIKNATRDMVEDLVIYGVDSLAEYYNEMTTGGTLVIASKKNTEFSFDDALIANDTSSVLKKKIEQNVDQVDILFSISDIWKDSLFQVYIESGKKYKKKFEESTRKTKKEYKKERIEGKSLGIDNLLFVNPIYLNVDLKKDKLNYLYSEKRQATFKKHINENAKKLGLTVNVLDMNHLDAGTMKGQDYNEIVVINNWVDELMDHGMFMICSNYNEVLPITENYNSNHFVYTGVYTLKGGNRTHFARTGNPGGLVDLGLLFGGVTTPIGIFNIVTKKKSSLYFTVVFDFKNHSIILSDVNTMNINDKPVVIKSNLYWNMLQMKRSADTK